MIGERLSELEIARIGCKYINGNVVIWRDSRPSNALQLEGWDSEFNHHPEWEKVTFEECKSWENDALIFFHGLKSLVIIRNGEWKCLKSPKECLDAVADIPKENRIWSKIPKPPVRETFRGSDGKINPDITVVVPRWISSENDFNHFLSISSRDGAFPFSEMRKLW